MIKRRTLWIAPSIMLMLLLLGYCHVDWLKVEEMRAKPNTLRSRILAYERRIRTDDRFPTYDQTSAEITKMMEDYFKIGMTEEECVRILNDNDLTVDERNSGILDDTKIPDRVFFNPSLVSRIDIPTGVPLLTLEYRLILRFINGSLVQIVSSRVGSGP